MENTIKNVLIFYSNDDIELERQIVRQLPKNYEKIRQFAGTSCDEIRDSIGWADAILLLLSASFFSDDNSGAIYDYLIFRDDLPPVVGILVRSCILPSNFPYPIVPYHREHMPTDAVEKDVWLVTTLTQLKLLLENLFLKQQLQAKDAEINMLRFRIEENNKI